MDYLADLDERIDRWWTIAKPLREDFAQTPERPKLPAFVDQFDARSFLRGLDAEDELYRIDDGYKLFSPKLLAPRADGRDKQWNLIEYGNGKVRVRDETIVHYGVAADLFFDHGWSTDQILSEPFGDGVVTKGSVDLVLIRDGATLVAVEAKGAPKLASTLVAGMNMCEGTPQARHNRQDHKKCEGLLLFRPDFFWVVAAGQTRTLFKVMYDDHYVRLEPTEDEGVVDAR